MKNPRRAVNADLDGLHRLIAPRVADGTLLPERALNLSRRLRNLWVLDEDEDIVACAELRVFNDAGEVACLIVRDDRHGRGFGRRLLYSVETHARQLGLRRLFALSADAADWFAMRGFADGQNLPPERHAVRRSTPLFKSLR